jgi:thiosulfate dehydrogenase
MKKYFIGGLSSILILLILGMICLFLGALPMTTLTGPLPFEKTIAHVALGAAIGSAEGIPSPVSAEEINLVAGAKLYVNACAVCHGGLSGPPTSIASGLFPSPPQLLPPKKGVTDDSVGETYWKVKNGIRFTGMPGFAKSFSETEMWQVSEFLLNADKLPATAAKVVQDYDSQRH